MRIGVVVRYWPALTETFVAREVAELRRRGHEVVVIGLGTRSDSKLADVPDVPVLRPRHRIRGLMDWLRWRLHGRPTDPHRLGLRPRDRARAWALGRRLPDLDRLHVHFAGEALEYAAPWAEARGLPLSVTLHAVDVFRPRPHTRAILRQIPPQLRFTVADHHRAWILDHWGLETQILRMGVPTDVPVARPGDAGPLRVVCAARDVPKKGLGDLEAAVRTLDCPVTLRLLSDRPAGGTRVVAGLVPPGRVPGILARSHVFALPCRVARDGDRDGVPVALLEAMAAGLPVVTTPVAGIPEVVDETVGWLVPPEDPAALSQALQACAANPAERARRGTAARRRILERGYTVAGQVNRLLEFWEWNRPSMPT